MRHRVLLVALLVIVGLWVAVLASAKPPRPDGYRVLGVWSDGTSAECVLETVNDEYSACTFTSKLQHAKDKQLRFTIVDIVGPDGRSVYAPLQNHSGGDIIIVAPNGTKAAPIGARLQNPRIEGAYFPPLTDFDR